MKMINIRMFPAQNGDCLLISVGDEHILVDGGYSITYYNSLKPYLQSLANKHAELALLIITHIDSDHIGGILSLLEENKSSFSSEIIPIRQIWHNSYRHLQYQAKQNYESYITDKNKVEAIIESIVARKYKSVDDAGKGPISAKQGSALGGLILQGGYSWNTDFADSAVSVENNPQVELSNGAKIILISPQEEKLQDLDNHWLKEINKRGCFGDLSGFRYIDDAFEYLISFEDEIEVPSKGAISSGESITIDELLAMEFEEDHSISNGSSIAFVLEYKDKKILFLGDAHSNQVLKSLKSIYGSKEYKETPLWFDAIKVSHHGSSKSLSPELLEWIDAEYFLFSTNGNRHGHPHKATLARIIARKSTKQRCLLFNYSTDTSIFFDRDDWKSQFNYTIFAPEINDEKIINLEIKENDEANIKFESN